ncbi:hypothetical protein SAMN05216299_1392 [Nitrosospira sp. Nsp14]|nr:hypothetical protein SAMN05216299_1392 [Nitrosospira sp. Nsp14]
MIKIGQFSTPENTSLVLGARIGLHLRNQKSESLLTLQKRFCGSATPGARVVFTESLLLLYALGKLTFDHATDTIFYNENTED